jgi:hypothetical protein
VKKFHLAVTQTMTNPVAMRAETAQHRRRLPASGAHAMQSKKITPYPTYLRADIAGRESAAATGRFLTDIGREMSRLGLSRVLIAVRESRAIFKVEEISISQHFKALEGRKDVRIALFGDSSELHASHGYMEVLARQRGVNVRAFRDEGEALDWLLADD